MARVLVVANETLGGRALAAKARELKDADPGLQIVICVPRTNPRFDGGWVWPLALLITAGVWLNPLALSAIAIRLTAGLHPANTVGQLWLYDRQLWPR